MHEAKSGHCFRMPGRICAAAILATCCAAAGGAAAFAEPLMEPPVLKSQNGVLDIMMVAVPEPVPDISFTPRNGGGPIHPTAWVYEVCPRSAEIATRNRSARS
jgi:hypothetical protein